MDEQRKVRKQGGREGEGQVGSRRDRLTDCFDGVQYPHGKLSFVYATRCSRSGTWRQVALSMSLIGMCSPRPDIVLWMTSVCQA